MLYGENLKQLSEKYLTFCGDTKELRERTIKNKREIYSRLLKFLNGREITPESIEAYSIALKNGFFGKKWCGNSRKTDLRYIKVFVKWLFKKGHLAKDWSDAIEYPKVVVNDEDIPSALKALDIILEGTKPGIHDHIRHRERKHEMRVFLIWMLLVPMRPFELNGLLGENIYLDAEEPFYKIRRKGGKMQNLPIPYDFLHGELLQELKKRQKQEFAFHINSGTANHLLRLGTEKLGIADRYPDFDMGSLRKIAITAPLAHGAIFTAISKVAGHTNPAITYKIYTQYNMSEQKQAMMYHPVTQEKMDREDRMLQFIPIMKNWFGHDERFRIEKDEMGLHLIDVEKENKEKK
jgi:integrase